MPNNSTVSASNPRKTTDQFILEAQVVHKDRYDYSKVQYKNTHTKVEIICKVHGTFLQIPKNHIKGAGCVKCNLKRTSDLCRKTTDQFIIDSKLTHKNRYDYSKVIYKNKSSEVEIICKEHDSFFQIPKIHIKGSNCPKCSIKRTADLLRKTTKQFISEGQSIHNNKYDYSKVIYTCANTKVEIICPKHGSFFQNPRGHINLNQGCPTCNESKGEKKVAETLTSLNIPFIRQHKFPNCKNILELPFDFYLPNHNTLIEYQGVQHFEEVKAFGGADTLTKTKNNDKIKEDFAKQYNYKLITIPFSSYDQIPKIIQTSLFLL